MAKKNKLLFIHSGSIKKKFIFEIASSLNIEIFLLNPTQNWAEDYVKECYSTVGLTIDEILELSKEIHKDEHLDGVITFWEEDVPTCALISEYLKLTGNKETKINCQVLLSVL